MKLFEHGTQFVSRSEARRLMHGLKKFKKVTLDFRGVKGVGQGFADEVFRVWPAAHRGGGGGARGDGAGGEVHGGAIAGSVRQLGLER